jgi:hypothetical protein
VAAPLKQRYPRLPLCLTADGLYPYQGFFARYQANGWAFIVTFKDGNLPSVWEEVQAFFGEAYFVQALTREYSFIKAFYAAKRSIEQREANENKTPSLPQIHMGTAIAKKLEVLAGRRNTRITTSRP